MARKTALLQKLKNDGKAFVYHNKNWKAYVTIVLSSPGEVADVVTELTGSQTASPWGLSGFSLTSAFKNSNAGRHYLMWIDNRGGMSTIGALAHEAVHISGLVLSDCGVSVDLKDISASECLAYLVEDIMRFTLPKLDWRGLDVSKLIDKEDKNEHFGAN